MSRRRRAGAAPSEGSFVGVCFPVAYLRVIDGEARHLGLRRGQFISLLLKRKAGIVLVERSPTAPTYEVTKDELTATEKYCWNMRSTDRAQADQARLRLGNISLGSYILFLVNDWLGQPAGLALRTPDPAEAQDG